MTANVFLQITKVDEAKRLVYARVTDETIDKADEIFDYDTSKPHFEAWSADVQKASGGKSHGNVRSMHGKVAAGTIKSIGFDDAHKAIDAVISVSDDNEWRKCLDGTHTGVSIGGSYVKKWPDEVVKTATRYTAKPIELSLVDRPCNPNSLFFDVLKADGTVLQKAFQTTEPETVTGESVGNEMERMLKDGELSLPEMLKAMQDAAALKKEDAADPEAKKEVVAVTEPVIEELTKDEETFPSPGVGNMVHFMFGDAAAQGVITEAVDNRATVQVGDKFISVDFKSLAHVRADTGAPAWNLVAPMPTSAGFKVEEAEVTKLEEPVAPDINELLKGIVALQKAGARHSAGDNKLLQTAHDALIACGAKCAEPEGKDFQAYAESKKVLTSAIEKGLEKRLEVVEADKLALTEQLAKITGDYATLEDRLKKVEDTPAAPKGKLMRVDHNGVVTRLDEEKASDDDAEKFVVADSKGQGDVVASLIKLAQSRGRPLPMK